MRLHAAALLCLLTIPAAGPDGRADIRTHAATPGTPAATPLDPALFAEFQWRNVGPLDGNAATGPHPDFARLWQVTTDGAFPYRVCAASAESGAMCVASRSDRGRITLRDWAPVGPAGAAFVAVDPGDADVLYLSAGGTVRRLDRRTGQAQDVSPPRTEGAARSTRAPLAFSTLDRKTLFHGARTVWKTSTAGQTWSAIGPDLPSGSIAIVAPSYVDARAIWAATGEGAIQVTRDAGASWTDVTPPDAASAGAAVEAIEPSHFDASGAYAAIRQGAARPRLYRTRNGGAAWVDIAGGLPGDAAVHAVREDPLRRGLLFAGTDTGVHVSFDDGDTWQSLSLNLPGVAIRDLVVRDADLVAATDGRGVWILDDLMPLRQLTPDVARAPAFLFRPATAWRFREGQTDAPGASNPPDGVVISYLLGAGPPATAGRGAAAAGPPAAGDRPAPVSLEIIDTASGETLRRVSSHDASEPLAATPGLHRYVWDVRSAPPPVAGRGMRGIFAPPGTYQVRLTVDGRMLRQAVSVRLDPRVKAAAADLAAQFTLSKSVDAVLRQVAAARDAASARGDASAVARLDAALAPLADVLEALQGADARPTDAQQAAAASALERAAAALAAG
jgi:hypothetical protein